MIMLSILATVPRNMLSPWHDHGHVFCNDNSMIITWWPCFSNPVKRMSSYFNFVSSTRIVSFLAQCAKEIDLTKSNQMLGWSSWVLFRCHARMKETWVIYKSLKLTSMLYMYEATIAIRFHCKFCTQKLHKSLNANMSYYFLSLR